MRSFYEEKGLMCTLVSRVLNVATLGFTVAFSGFLLLFVDWAAVRHGCPVEDECDFVKLAVYKCAPRQNPRPLFYSSLVVAQRKPRGPPSPSLCKVERGFR
jgi:hypothetical protein